MSGPRFLALAGSDPAIRDMLGRHIPAKDGSPKLNRRFDRPGLVIFTSPETPAIPLQLGMGLVVGLLLRKTGERVTSLGFAASRAAIENGGLSLVRDYWGNFVAFLRQGRRTLVVRDPSAALPAYVRECGEIQLICSDLEVADGLAEKPEVDREFVRQWLSLPFLRTSRTGLQGWHEVLPGTCHDADGCTKPLWVPSQSIEARDDPMPFAEAASHIRNTALLSVPKLIAGCSRPVLELSGGLDSSIVAACLHRAGITFDAVNFATRMPDGDERQYARAVASHLELSLTELSEDDRPIGFEVPPPRLFRPPLSPVLQPLDRARRAFAEAHGVTTFITGAGGDNIFCYLGTAAPILDSFADRGLTAAFGTAREVAELGDCTIFKALGFAVRKAARFPYWRHWARDRRFLAEEAIAGRPDPHPWLAIPARSRAGSIEHVKSLVRAQHFLESEYGLGDAVRHPLLNQPLMEACLSVPSWLWVRDGRNRSVARAAFADMLPDEIIQRRTKGRLESMCARAFRDTRQQLAALLLEGVLDRDQMIDRPAVEAYLRSDGQPRGDDYFRIFDLASLELWLRSWCR